MIRWTKMKKYIAIISFTLILLTGCSTTETLSFLNDLLDLFENEQIKQTELKSALEHKDLDLHEMQVHFIDTGQADATLIRFYDAEDEFHILYDTGDWKGNEVVPYLETLDIDQLDLVIISHPHADHIGQLKEVIENFSIGELWMTGNETNTNLFETTLETIMNYDIPFVEPEAGEVLTIGPLTIEVLHPTSSQLTGDLNRDSLSARFTYGDVSFMFTGDGDHKTEADIMKHFKEIDAHVLHLGHHGSNTSSSEAFLNRVSPQYAIYSAGIDNKYGHPHDEVIDLLQKNSITTFGTDKDGSIVLTTDGQDIHIETYPK